MGATKYAQAKKAPAVALYYQHNAPLEDLKVFDIVVVEPDHGYDPLALRAKGTELYAYTSVAEVQPTRAYFKNIPAQWQMARNGHWNSVVVDQTPAQWPAFFADQGGSAPVATGLPGVLSGHHGLVPPGQPL